MEPCARGLHQTRPTVKGWPPLSLSMGSVDSGQGRIETMRAKRSWRRDRLSGRNGQVACGFVDEEDNQGGREYQRILGIGQEVTMLEQVHITLTVADMALTVWVLAKARHTSHVESELGVQHPKRYRGRHRQTGH